ncbi:MAG TPA: class I SAM-dependent methyltransferase [Magnetospirillum sp.]|nr:class I SAM-dependent methyltransferase [Magnetospirillum sp.]
MRSYPRIKRNVDDRAARITDDHRAIARQFGQEFFDGDRLCGYGGYRYDGRWKPVVRDFVADYGLAPDCAILDIGCAKGFMVRDFVELLPQAQVRGIDISEYAVANADPVARPCLSVANCRELPFPDASFDLVISINTAHNLPYDECGQALKEMMRVTRKHAFVVLDAYRDDAERERMLKWNLTARTILHVDEWTELFAKVGYTGDYDWFTP